jgi:hypothetical protein
VTESWLLITVSLTVLLGFFGLILLRWRGRSHAPEADWNWIRDFSPERYRPMERLLSKEDDLFLRSQPGYDPSMSRTLRTGRRRVFRSYLQSLRRDFNRLYYVAKVCAIYGAGDQSELVSAIARQRVVFYRVLFQVEVRFALHWAGVGEVDIRPLLEPLSALRAVACSFEPAAA